MNSAPRVGFLARNFGWSGSRQEWLTLFGLIAWVVAGVALWRYSKHWTVGESVLAGCVWLLAVLLAAQDAVRNLFGPVFTYELVRLGRNRWTFWLRWAYILLIAGTLFTMYWAWWEGRRWNSNEDLLVSTGVLAQFGTEFFETFICIQFIVVSLLTPVYVAGTIVVEKERKTLEFLFATDLANREIIFGKLAARVINLLMYVFAGLPLLAFTQLFGGVDPELVLASFLATCTTVVGYAAVSMWFSTFSRKARDAIMLSYMAITLYLVFSLFLTVIVRSPLAGWWNTDINILGVTFGLHDLIGGFAEGNIFWQLILTQSRTPIFPRVGASDALRNYVLWWGIVSFLLLFHATMRLRAVSLQQAYGSPGGTRSRKKKVATATGEEKIVVNEAVSKHPPIGSHPMLWKEVFVEGAMRCGCAGRIMAALVLILIFIWPVLIFYFEYFNPWMTGGRTFSQNFYSIQESINVWVRITTGAMTGLMCLSVALRGAGAVSGERDKDTWISLLSTAMPAGEMLTGKWWGCVLSIRRMFAVLFLIWCIGLSLGAVDPVMLLLDAICIVVFLSAFAWIGLFCSLTARNTLVASVRAFFAATFFGGGYWLVFLLCCVLPCGLSGARINVDRDFLWLLQTLLAMTPPFLTGWIPLSPRDWDNEWRLEPFSNRNNGFGLMAPILGMMLWLGFTVFLRFYCHWKFREVANRESEFTDLPVPKIPDRVKTPKQSRYE